MVSGRSADQAPPLSLGLFFTDKDIELPLCLNKDRCLNAKL